MNVQYTELYWTFFVFQFSFDNKINKVQLQSHRHYHQLIANQMQKDQP